LLPPDAHEFVNKSSPFKALTVQPEHVRHSGVALDATNCLMIANRILYVADVKDEDFQDRTRKAARAVKPGPAGKHQRPDQELDDPNPKLRHTRYG
jgi:hypothetical protein